MTQVVYIDVLLAVNLIINYFLLTACMSFCKLQARIRRRLLGSALGAVYSFILFLPELPVWGSVIVRLIMSATIALAAFGWVSPRRFLRALAGFYAVSFAFAGIMFGLWVMFKPAGMVISNSVVYFNISPLLLVFFAALCYLVFSLAGYFVKQRAPDNKCYTVEIRHHDKTLRSAALLDTGNSVSDLFTGNPVVIAEYSLIEPLLDPNCRHLFKNSSHSFAGTALIPPELKKNYRILPYSTLSGSGIMPAFSPDKITVFNQSKKLETSRITVAVSGQLSGEYRVLLGSDILENTKWEDALCI